MTKDRAVIEFKSVTKIYKFFINVKKHDCYQFFSKKFLIRKKKLWTMFHLE